MDKQTLWYDYLIFVSTSILGFCLGSIFNVVSIPAGGMNRYLFIFLIPLLYHLVKSRMEAKKKHFLITILLGICLGIFSSDFQDFVTMLITQGSLFVLIFILYIMTLHYYFKIRRRAEK